MTRTKIACIAVAALATTALAHGGVEDAEVMARMHGMDALADRMEIIADMVKGKRGFDAQQARDAALGISEEAAKIPLLFASPASDPKSEALPVIWERFDDFTAKAGDLEQAAKTQSGAISDPDSLTVALRAMGATCKACHDTYRK